MVYKIIKKIILFSKSHITSTTHKKTDLIVFSASQLSAIKN
jgi:hypothetical protein